MSGEKEGSIKRDFLILIVSAFFIYTYYNVFMMTTPLIISKMNGSNLIVGLQATIFLLTAIVLRLYFGPLADVRGRRITMLIGSISFLVASVLFLFAEEVWQVIMIRLLQAVGLASYFPSVTATAAAFGGCSLKGTYIGLLRIIMSISLMIGSIVSFNLIHNYGYDLLMLCMTLVAFLGVLFVLFLSEDLLKPEQTSSSKLFVWQRLNFWPLLTKCRFIVGSTFAAAIGYGILISFAALFIKDNTSIKNAGFFFALFSIGGIFANVTFGWISDHLGRMRLTVSAFVILGCGIVLFAFLPQISLFFYPAGLLAGVGYYGSIVVLMAWITDKAPLAERTAALSLQQNSIDFGIAIGSGLFGILVVCTKSDMILYGLLGLFYIFFAIFHMLYGKSMRIT